MGQENYVQDYHSTGSGLTKSAASTLFRNVYLWMTLALVITGLTALTTVNSPGMLSFIYGSKFTFFGLLIAEVVVVIALTAAINKISFATASLGFIAYSILTGLTLSVYLLVYTEESVATTLFITAGTFGAMSLYGTLTKKDLSSWGSILIMGVIGLIISMLVNMFWQNSMFDLIISCVGVLIFTGLCAYDSQKIKQLLHENVSEVNDSSRKLALLGALSLYLDFVNLFIYLLRLLGKRK
ncbi:MAG: Bax inhibitor-1/YccA family protein [Clostridium sp.]|nr:Bax inhibitor-1/YccA family protein [Clostridium sp.]